MFAELDGVQRPQVRRLRRQACPSAGATDVENVSPNRGRQPALRQSASSSPLKAQLHQARESAQQERQQWEATLQVSCCGNLFVCQHRCKPDLRQAVVCNPPARQQLVQIVSVQDT